MSRIRPAAAALLLFCAALAVEAREPLTHEAMWMMKRVGPPSLSPDGRLVVFSVTDPSYDAKEQSTDLWIVPADGSSRPRRITFSKTAESDVQWSPDSRRIAFVAQRDGDEASQVYLLDVAGGGEARRVTSIAAGVRSPRFSPAGDALLFSSSVFRGAADEEANKKAAKDAKERKTNVRIYDSFPIRAWDRWIDPEKQVHLFVQPLAEGSPAKDLLAGTKLVSHPGFGGALGGESGENLTGEWSPDGRWVVFSATTTRNTGAFAEVDSNLYRVSANGGEPEPVAAGGGSYSTPEFSPDGRTLYAIFNPNNGKVYNLNRIVAFDWPSMANRRVLTAASDRSPDDVAVSHDGRTVYFTAEDSGLVKIYAVQASGGEARLALDPQRGTYSDLRTASSGALMVGRWGSSINPAEIVRIDLASKKHTNLTDFNVAAAANIDWQPPQHFWFTNKAGRRIHNMIVLPPGFDAAKKYPLFVLIHGGAANMWRDSISLRWNYHLLAKPGYVMLMTNYTGSTGFGEELSQAIQGDPLKGPADDVNQGADEAIRRYPFIDATRQVAGGASYGGHLANWLEATTTRYKALISHAGMAHPATQWATSDVAYGREVMMGGPVWEGGAVWNEQSAIMRARDFKTPILMSIGEKDYRVPLNNTLEMWVTLQRMKVPSRLLVWPDENHWILNGENSRLFYREVHDWIARWIK